MKYTNLKMKKGTKSPNPKKLTIFLLAVGMIASAWFILKNRAHGAFNAISIVMNVAAADIKSTDGRTNVLVLGSDKRTVGAVTSMLTDTLLVASIGRVDNDVILISVPRDLWVQNLQGYRMKINEVYAYGGAGEASKMIQQVLGIPIHYYALVDFSLFKDTVNTLGGVELTVDRAFTDYYYPIEGKENAPETERYEVVHFDAGVQTMDGEKALKFTRSRHGDNNEGTDFARARRQQKVITAIKGKMLSVQTLINPQKLKELYDIYSKKVDTDIELSTLQNFYLLSQQIKFDRVESVVLDTGEDAEAGGLLYAPEDRTLYGGLYVLIPKTGNYSQIHAYVQKYLFGEK